MRLHDYLETLIHAEKSRSYFAVSLYTVFRIVANKETLGFHFGYLFKIVAKITIKIE